MTQPDYRRQLLTAPGGLAERLSALLDESPLNGTQLAEKMGELGVTASLPKISKICSGRQLPSTDDIEAWCSACGQPDAAPELARMANHVRSQHRTWRTRLKTEGGQAAVQSEFQALDANARLIRNFETAVFPGLLQVRPMAEAVLRQFLTRLGRPAEDIMDGVEGRLRRQEVLYTDQQFEFILDEVLLVRPIFGVDVTIKQIDRLQNLVGASNIRLGILPIDKPLNITPLNGFLLLDDVALVETLVGETRHEGEEAAEYHQIMDQLWAEAIEGDAVLPRLARAGEMLRRLRETTT